MGHSAPMLDPVLQGEQLLFGPLFDGVEIRLFGHAIHPKLSFDPLFRWFKKSPARPICGISSRGERPGIGLMPIEESAARLGHRHQLLNLLVERMALGDDLIDDAEGSGILG